MRWLFFLLTIQNAFSDDLGVISRKVQNYLTGTYFTSIVKQNYEYSGSELDSELMFDVYVQGGEQRFCLFIRKKKVRLFKSKQEMSCLGEKVLEYEIDANWGWIYLPIRYLGEDIMALRFINKKNEKFFDIKFPNMGPKEDKEYKLWDSPRSKHPFGFAIYTTLP